MVAIPPGAATPAAYTSNGRGDPGAESQHRSDSPVVELRGIHKDYGNATVLHPLDLRIYPGEFVAILGPSGCGKSTLLKTISGFVEPSGGTVLINGENVTRVRPNRRLATNMVFQGYGLFPHMSSAQNIAYGLKIARHPENEIRKKVSDALALVHMEDYGEKPVTELSGGQAQRIALARALVMDPKVLLLDEPLAALDLKLRKAMQRELRSLHSVVRGTFVFVTHDQEEAMALASRICVMQAGTIVQDGPPEAIYSEPASRFVADFIGEANSLGGLRCGGEVRLHCGARFASHGPDGPIACVVRPECLSILPQTPATSIDPQGIRVEGTVEDAVFLGPSTKYRVSLNGECNVTVDNRVNEGERIAVGTKVTVEWRREYHRVFAAD